MVAGRDEVDTGREHLVRGLLGEPEAARSILAVRDNAVNAVLLTRKREMLLQRLAPGSPDNIADNEQVDRGLYDRALALALPECTKYTSTRFSSRQPTSRLRCAGSRSASSAPS